MDVYIQSKKRVVIAVILSQIVAVPLQEVKLDHMVQVKVAQLRLYNSSTPYLFYMKHLDFMMDKRLKMI